MVDVISIMANTLRIVGLADLPITVNFADGERGDVILCLDPSSAPHRTRLLQVALLAILSVNSSILAATSQREPFTLPLTVALAAVTSALSINLVISALRSPRRAASKSATPGRLPQ